MSETYRHLLPASPDLPSGTRSPSLDLDCDLDHCDIRSVGSGSVATSSVVSDEEIEPEAEVCHSMIFVFCFSSSIYIRWSGNKEYKPGIGTACRFFPVISCAARKNGKKRSGDCRASAMIACSFAEVGQ